MSAFGWWCVAETGQGSALPDTLHGPFWNEEDAQDVREQLTDESRSAGRRDIFTVCTLEPQEPADAY